MTLGELLRKLRKTQRRTLEQLAERAEVSRVTLSRWETGAVQPRLAELEAVLQALAATSEQRRQALSLLNAPRAVARLRQEAEQQQIALVERVGQAPAIGDLLRAMRQRQRMTVEQVARGLGVAPRSVRRWEKSEASVPTERLDELCRLLRAAPQERVALGARRLWLWTPGEGTAFSLEQLHQQCLRLNILSDQGEHALLDLEYLNLEAQLWPRATREAGAQSLLGVVYGWHGVYLERQGRRDEVKRSTEQAKEMLLSTSARPSWWAAIVHSLVWANRPGFTATDSLHRVELLRRWLDYSPDPSWQGLLYRDMAQYATEAGAIEAALGWIGEAERLAQRQEDADKIRRARHIRIYALLASGRAVEALPLLPEEENSDVFQRYFELCQRVEVLLAAGDRTGAQEGLARFYAFCREYSHPVERAEELARRL